MAMKEVLHTPQISMSEALLSDAVLCNTKDTSFLEGISPVQGTDSEPHRLVKNLRDIY